MKQKIKTTMDDLITAFETDEVESFQYLNKETGRFVIGSEFSDSFDEYGNEIDDVDEYLQKSGIEKYLEIPGTTASIDFEDMEEFIGTVGSEKLQDELNNALNQRHPFGNFRDVLASYPHERNHWDHFKEGRIKERIKQWLEENNLELEEE